VQNPRAMRSAATCGAVLVAVTVLTVSCRGAAVREVTDEERLEVATLFAEAVVSHRDAEEAMRYANPELDGLVEGMIPHIVNDDLHLSGKPVEGCPSELVTFDPLPEGPCWRFRMRSDPAPTVTPHVGSVSFGWLLVAVTSHSVPPRVTAVAGNFGGKFVPIP